MTAADRHQRITADFTRLVEGTADWDAPAPVDGWVARDVVDHLVSWFRAFLEAGGIEVPPGPAVADDPVGAWVHHRDAVQGLLDSPDAARDFTHPFAGTHALQDAIDRFYTTDVFLHTWDLGTATGQHVALDPAHCLELLEGMGQIEEMLRSSGQYGPAVPVPRDADPQTRLVGFIGRDPQWTPPGR